MQRQTSQYTILLTTIACFLVASCGQPGTPGSGTTGQADDADTVAMAAQAPASVRYGTEHGHVPLGELTCAQADLPLHIQHGTTTQHAPYTTTTNGIQVKSASLLAEFAQIQPCQPTGPIERCAIVHLGLDSTNRFEVRLQLLCMTYDAMAETYEYQASNDCFVIGSDGDLSLERDGMLAWRAPGGGWDNYATRVVIQPDNDGRWVEFNKETEPHSFVFSEQHISALIRDNALSNGKLSIVPIATPEERTLTAEDTYAEKNYHQGVAWLPLDVELDNTTYPGEPFKNKACDLGSPCPPNYPGAGFAFWTKGTPPRATCN